MTDTVIRVENLAKLYTLGPSRDSSRYKTLRESFTDLVSSPFRRSASQVPTDEFWALKDVSFEIKRGEVVGIIGRNGAGKSTLLKILSRITDPTNGRVTIKGRVASLLEVGTGFHPELTGRENIFLNGAILGMSRVEIKAKFDEIVAFAEVEKFLDTPVKRYSSGMYVRLAFAVAAHLEPEILIVDEVLAVGDTEFQKKCLGKMGEVASGGRTVLFVSHNLHAVTALTNRCFLLKKGELQASGPTRDVLNGYFLEGGGTGDLRYDAEGPYKEPRIRSAQVLVTGPDRHQTANHSLELRFEIETRAALRGAAFSFQIIDTSGLPMVHLMVLDSETPFGRAPGVFTLRCVVPKLRLYLGLYTLTLHFAETSTNRHFETLHHLCLFEVVAPSELRDLYWRPDTCAYLEDATWQVEAVNDPDRAS